MIPAILALALAGAPFSTSGGGGSAASGAYAFIDGGLGMVQPGPGVAGIRQPLNQALQLVNAADAGCVEYGWDGEPATNAMYLNTQGCDDSNPQVIFQIDGNATTQAPFSSGAVGFFRTVESTVAFVGRSGAPFEAPMPSSFQGKTSDNATSNAFLMSNVSPDSSESYGHNPGVKAHDDDNAFIRLQAVGYSNTSVKDYGFLGENVGILAGSLAFWLDNTSRDGFLTSFCADPSSTACTEGIADVYCPAGANPRTCTTIRTQDKTGNETHAGAVEFGTFSGTTPPVTCGASWRGAVATKLGDGSTTNDKSCRCVNAAGTYKWTSIDLVTGTITATGNTTTCN